MRTLRTPRARRTSELRAIRTDHAPACAGLRLLHSTYTPARRTLKRARCAVLRGAVRCAAARYIYYILRVSYAILRRWMWVYLFGSMWVGGYIAR